MSDTPETYEAVERWRQGKINIFDEMARLERERDEAREDAKRATYDAAQETIKVSTAKSHWIEACRERDEARKTLPTGAKTKNTKRTQNNMSKTAKEENVTIKPPSIATASFKIVGTSPYIQLRFSQKAIETMMAKHAAGSQANKKKAKEARDFDADFEAAKHISTDGWCGIPASAFRNAMISACRLVGFKMTLAKLSLFTEADGFDKVDLVPLIKITGDPEKHIMHARNATGVCDIRVRAKFWPWSANVRISYDTDQFSATDVANLLQRVGQQVGIGEGRNDSKMSAGMGWGCFTLATE